MRAALSDYVRLTSPVLRLPRPGASRAGPHEPVLATVRSTPGEIRHNIPLHFVRNHCAIHTTQLGLPIGNWCQTVRDRPLTASAAHLY